MPVAHMQLVYMKEKRAFEKHNAIKSVFCFCVQRPYAIITKLKECCYNLGVSPSRTAVLSTKVYTDLILTFIFKEKSRLNKCTHVWKMRFAVLVQIQRRLDSLYTVNETTRAGTESGQPLQFTESFQQCGLCSYMNAPMKLPSWCTTVWIKIEKWFWGLLMPRRCHMPTLPHNTVP